MRAHRPRQSEFVESRVELQHDIVEKPRESLWLHDRSERPWNRAVAEHCAYWVLWRRIPESDIVQFGVFLDAVGEDLVRRMEEQQPQAHAGLEAVRVSACGVLTAARSAGMLE